jgi:hypothetical protein
MKKIDNFYYWLENPKINSFFNFDFDKILLRKMMLGSSVLQ